MTGIRTPDLQLEGLASLAARRPWRGRRLPSTDSGSEKDLEPGAGLEPTTSSLQGRYSAKLSYPGDDGQGGRSRTCDNSVPDRGLWPD